MYNNKLKQRDMETIKIGRKNFTNLVNVNVKGSKVVDGVRFYTYEQAQIAAVKFNATNGGKYRYEIPTTEDFTRVYNANHKNGVRNDETAWGRPGSFGTAVMVRPDGVKLLGKIKYNPNYLSLWCSDKSRDEFTQTTYHIGAGDTCPSIFATSPRSFMMPLVLIEKLA